MENKYIEIVTKSVKENLSYDEIRPLLIKNEEQLKKQFSEIQIEGVSESFYKLFAQYCVEQGFDDDDVCGFIDAKIYSLIDSGREKLKRGLS